MYTHGLCYTNAYIPILIEKEQPELKKSAMSAQLKTGPQSPTSSGIAVCDRQFTFLATSLDFPSSGDVPEASLSASLPS